MKQDIEILKAGNTGDIFRDAQNTSSKHAITPIKQLMWLWCSVIGC